MMQKRRLVDDISQNLDEYRENIEKILNIIINQSDVSSKRHNPHELADEVQVLLDTDRKFKYNMERAKTFMERQRKIKKMEKESARLSNQVNHFTKSVSKKQNELREFIFKAKKMQDDINANQDVASIQKLIQTAHLVGPASGPWMPSSQSGPWMPSLWQMQLGVNAVETLDLPAPSVATKTFSFAPIVRTRDAASLFFSDSDSGSGSDDDDSESS